MNHRLEVEVGNAGAPHLPQLADVDLLTSLSALLF
jgi:hypothetical protein